MYTVYWYIPCEYLFEGDSFSCGWPQTNLMTEEEFDVRCGGPSKAYKPKQNHTYYEGCTGGGGLWHGSQPEKIEDHGSRI